MLYQGVELVLLELLLYSCVTAKFEKGGSLCPEKGVGELSEVALGHKSLVHHHPLTLKRDLLLHPNELRLIPPAIKEQPDLYGIAFGHKHHHQ